LFEIISSFILMLDEKKFAVKILLVGTGGLVAKQPLIPTPNPRTLLSGRKNAKKFKAMTIIKNISKWPKQFLPPTVILVIFIAGVALGVVLSSWLFVLGLAAVLAVFSLFSAVNQKKLFFVLFLVFALALLYASFFKYLYSSSLSSGCEFARIDSDVKSAGQLVRFGVVDQSGRRAVVETNSNLNFGYKDKLKLCFDSEQIKNQPALSRYLLSQYKSDLIIENPKIEFEERGRGAVRFLYDLTDEFSQKITSLFPGDEGVLSKGLLLGGTEGFSSSFKDHLKISGTSHLVAVSGYNVSIMTVVLFEFFRLIWSRRAAFVLSGLLLVVFCLMTGGSASVVRASIMGGLFLAQKALGRATPIYHFLVLAAFFMMLQNPYVIYDLGFQLSFAAMGGLIYLGSPIEKLIEAKVSQEAVKTILKVLTETISAQIFALPILLSGFGVVSIVSPITNVLILPFVPLAMLLIFIALVGALVWPLLGIFLAGIAAPLIEYFTAVINFFGSLKFAKISVSVMNWWWAGIIYVFILLLTAWVRKINKERFVNFCL